MGLFYEIAQECRDWGELGLFCETGWWGVAAVEIGFVFAIVVGDWRLAVVTRGSDWVCFVKSGLMWVVMSCRVFFINVAPINGLTCGFRAKNL